MRVLRGDRGWTGLDVSSAGQETHRTAGLETSATNAYSATAASAREDFELFKGDAGGDEFVLDIRQQHDGDAGKFLAR